MPWIRIDENAMEHPKIVGLSDSAFRLWVRGLAHGQKYLTDGQITRPALRHLTGCTKSRIDELLAAGLWEAHSDGFTVHDYLLWNESRAKVMDEREKSRTRFQRWREKRSSNAVATKSVATELHTTPHHRHSINQNAEPAPPPAKVAHDGPRLRIWHWQHEDLAKRLGAKVESFDLLGWYSRLEDELARTGEAFADPWKWLQERLYRDAKLPLPNLMGKHKEAPSGPAYKPYVPLRERPAADG